MSPLIEGSGKGHRYVISQEQAEDLVAGRIKIPTWRELQQMLVKKAVKQRTAGPSLDSIGSRVEWDARKGVKEGNPQAFPWLLKMYEQPLQEMAATYRSGMPEMQRRAELEAALFETILESKVTAPRADVLAKMERKLAQRVRDDRVSWISADAPFRFGDGELGRSRADLVTYEDMPWHQL